MIARLLSQIVLSGVTGDMPETQRYEIKLMNSIAFHSVLLTLFSGIAGWFVIPKHAFFVSLVVMTEMTAKICVILLNHVHRYLIAKVVFSFITLFVFLLIIWYFGLELNFQFLILTIFITLMIVYRNSSSSDIFITVLYLVIGMIGCGIAYLSQDPIVKISQEEIEGGKSIAYAMNLSIIVMVSVIFFKSSRHRKMATEENLRELSGVTNILNTISLNLNEGIYKSRVNGGMVYMNDSFIRMFAFTDKDQLVDQDPHQLYSSPQDRDDILDELHENAQVSNRLVRFRRQDESRFWGRLSCKLIVEDGLEFLVGTVTDVTVQQEHESMLRESENQLREAQRIAKIGNWQLFNASKILRWSDECIRIHGLNSIQSDYDYRDWLDRLSDMDEAKLNTLMAKAMMTKENVEFQSWYTSPEGERKFLVYVTRYQRSEKVKGGVWYGTVQDFTVQHVAEQRIIETKQFYEDWIDKLPIESVMFDDQLRYTYISENAVQDSETRAWMLGKTNRDYAERRGLNNGFFELRDKMLQKSIDEKKHVTWEEKMKTKDGLDSYHVRYIFPIEITERGKQKHAYIGYSFNISEIKNAELDLLAKNQELIGLNSELDRFVYSISHDLRAPIASVLGLIDLTKSTDSQEETKEMLEMQSVALKRMDQYICDVLDYSRNARLEIEFADIDIEDVVSKCFTELKFFHAKNREIEIKQDLEIKSLRADPLRFRIIVNNLLSNAIKYQDPKKKLGKVCVRTWINEDNNIVLSVQENGIGIRADLIGNIWDMFFRGTNKSAGSGLGLYILKESVSAIGAEVEVQSVEGEGSTFKVTFSKEEPS